MKVVRLSALRTGRLYPQKFSWYSFLEAESTPGHIVLSVASEKIPSDTTGDRSGDKSMLVPALNVAAVSASGIQFLTGERGIFLFTNCK